MLGLNPTLASSVGMGNCKQKRGATLTYDLAILGVEHRARIEVDTAPNRITLTKCRTVGSTASGAELSPEKPAVIAVVPPRGVFSTQHDIRLGVLLAEANADPAAQSKSAACLVM